MNRWLTEEEWMVVAHALRAEIERAEEKKYTNYSVLTIPRARDLLSRISEKKEDSAFSELREALKRGGAA